MDFYTELCQIMSYDAGGRGLHGPVPNLRGLGEALLKARSVLILTGFPVLPEGENSVPVGETDGPVGTAELARGLELLGCRVTVAVDAPAFPMARAALRAAGTAARLVLFPNTGCAAFGESLLDSARPEAVIALERPGKGADGHFHSMKGRVIDAGAADTDCVFATARRRGILTVGIGDGGNELGMGTLRRMTERFVDHGSQIATVLPADYTLTAGVSNWWGNGLTALLSYESGEPLLITQAGERSILQAVVDAGGVDGRTGRRTLSVDGLPLAVHLERLAMLERLIKDCGETRRFA